MDVESNFFAYKLTMLELMVGFAHDMGWVEDFGMIIDGLVINGLEFPLDAEEKLLHSLASEVPMVVLDQS